MSEVPVAAVEALFSETTGDAVRQFPEMAEKYGGSAGKKTFLLDALMRTGLKYAGQPRDRIGRFAHGSEGGGSSGSTISEAGVGKFLEGSAFPSPMYHNTSTEAARDITENGVNFEKTSFKSHLGAGFYVSENPLGQYGDVQLKVAIRSKNPKKGTAEELDRFIDSLGVKPPMVDLGTINPNLKGQRVQTWLTTAAKQEAIRKAVVKKGFDALVDTDRGIVVGVVKSNIRIVAPGAGF